MSRPRVVWVSTSTSTRGGVASYVRSMMATPLWSRWHVQHVATHQDGSVAQRIGRFAVGALRFWWLLLVRRPDVVHLHSASYGSFARKSVLAWSAYARRVPVVVHVHGGGFGDFHDHSPRVVRRFIRATLEKADVVVALGPTWAARLQQIAPAARVLVVPNAVAPAPPVERPADGPVTVLFLGLLSEDKGVHVLLEAWARVPSAGARLVVAGNGDLERFRGQARDLGIADRVELPGWVDRDRTEELLRESAVLVLPSRWEGHPMAVLEAMAHGAAVVATDVGGIPDLVDATSGILVAPDDVEELVRALTRVLSDADLRSSLGAGGLRRIHEHFDIDRTWRLLDGLYAELVR